MDVFLRDKIMQMLSSRLDNDRIEHGISVGKEATRLAERYGHDRQKAEMAGLLHDVCRCDHPKWMREYMRKHRCVLPVEWRKNPQLWHGPCASILIRRELGIRDREILVSIRFHTTGRPGMSDFEKIIFLADKIEPTRDYSGAREIRNAAQRSLDEAVFLALKGNITHLCQRGLPLVKETVGAYNGLVTAKLGK